MTPILLCSLFAAAGVLAGLRTAPDAGMLVPLALVLLLREGLVAAGRAPGWVRPLNRAIEPALAFALIGIVAGAAAAARLGAKCGAVLDDGASVTLRAVFEGEPVEGRSVPLRLIDVRSRGRAVVCSGTVRAKLAPGIKAPRAGVEVLAFGTWWAFPPSSRWPAPPELRGVLSLGSLRAAPAGRARHPLLRARGAVQRRLRRLLPERSGLAEALIVARREGMDPAVGQRFAAAGLVHLLSISGSHVGLIAGVLLLLGRMARLGPGAAGTMAGAVTLAYVLFLGAPAAAARAALQTLLLLASRLTQRPAHMVSALGLVALGLIAANPLSVLDAGFQLSFAGIFGLLVLRAPLSRLMPRALPKLLREGLGAGTAATLATMPIAALHFGQVAPVGVLANLVAIPLVAACVPSLGLTLAVSLVSQRGAAFLAGGTDLLLRALDTCATAAAALPGGHGPVARGTVIAWLIGVAAFLMLRARWRTMDSGGPGPARLRAWRLATAVAGAACVVGWWPLVGRHAGAESLEIHAIDVGQGDAIAIRTPHGHWIVVDAGPRSERYDAGRARVVPFLLRHGVRRVDVLVLTHPHADHIGGADALFEAFPVDIVVDPGVPTGTEMYVETLDHAIDRHVRWIAARPGRELKVDDVSLLFLAPLDEELDAHADPNDFSVIFRLGYGAFDALFLGDAPRSVENRLVASYGRQLAAALIKVGHHGSETSTGDSLLNAAAPSAALISVGRRNRYGHPDPEVLQRLRRHGIRILRTDLNGSLLARVRGSHLELLTAR